MKKKPTVIVVEDDANWMTDICTPLEMYFDVKIEKFDSFLKAEKRLLMTPINFDLLITDIYPPLSHEKKGLEFAKFVKEIINIPVIVITAEYDEGVTPAFRDYNIKEVFLKSRFSKMSFVAAIGKVIPPKREQSS